ncbi:MAG: hypothetical protein OXQ94_03760 [Gemmatimonadota bacterium]|nr:hypothetical protein [Gemmatimonadota bacterium]MDE2870793.1 hypothetical protein [Gemmatimonadota bacterium]
MRSTLRSLSAALAVAAASCGIVEERWPSEVAFEMRGKAGQQAMAIYSRDFIAGVDVEGVTQVGVLSSDTVLHTLPIDTTMSIAREQKWLVQVEALEGDTLDVSVSVEVDGRSLIAESGGIFPGDPWHFVYVFRQRLTRRLDVRF